MADLTAVVALLALGAVTAHVTETTARVAGGLASASVATGTATVASTAAAVSTSSTAVAATLGAVAGNVTDLTTLVALLAAAATATHLGTAVLGALARDVAGATAAVARLLSLGRSAFTANVALLTTVVASWGTLGGALGSAVRRVSAVVAATATGASSRCLVRVHFGRVLGKRPKYQMSKGVTLEDCCLLNRYAKSRSKSHTTN